MEIVRVYANRELENNEASVACVGFFDGVHRGHQMLIHKTIELAKKQQQLSACITFDVDPWIILKGDPTIENLTPVKKRLEIIADMGIKRCYLLHFDREMADLSKEAFVDLLNQLNVKSIVCGDDFRFAYKNSGDTAYLSERIDTIICPLMELDGIKVSSSIIEQDLKEGNLIRANNSLGYDYMIAGHVIKGRQVGRTLNFPTANISVDENYVVPKQGVYAGKIKVRDKWYLTAVSIGYNLTLNTRDFLSIEAHILNFQDDIYGEYVTLSFHTRLRDEMKFDGKEALIVQLEKDKESVEVLINEISLI